MFRPKWKLITNRHQMLTYIHIAARWPSCKNSTPCAFPYTLQMIRLNFLMQTGNEHKKQAPMEWARTHTWNTGPNTHTPGHDALLFIFGSSLNFWISFLQAWGHHVSVSEQLVIWALRNTTSVIEELLSFIPAYIFAAKIQWWNWRADQMPCQEHLSVE